MSWLVCLASLVVVVVGVAAFAAPSALALSQRGHVFAFSFGEAGTGDGQFSVPASVAVDEATGDVYVSDGKDARIERFSPERDGAGTIVSYKFVSAWGWGVADGEKKYEVCTSGCLAGLKGTPGLEGKTPHEGELDDPGQVAVDNSANPSDPSRGDVYVVANHVDHRSTVEKFGAAGEYLGRVTSFEESESDGVAEGVAVDSNGAVWVSWEAELVSGYGDGTPNALEHEVSTRETLAAGGWTSAPVRPGLAVSTVTVGSHEQDRLYFDLEPNGEEAEGKASKYCKSAKRPCVTAEIDAFTVEPDNEEALHGILPEGEEQVVSAGLGPQDTTGVASDPADGDAYVDDGTSIAALDSSGAEIQSFGSGEGAFAGLVAGAGLAVDHGAGSGVGDVLVADRSADTIDVFSPAPPGPPAVDGLFTREVTSESASLDAQIDAGGVATTYTVQYSTSACTESQSACAARFTCTAGPATCGELPDPPASAGEGFGDREVSVPLAGLAPSTTYHYRFLAQNAHGKAVSETEGAFSTPPAKGPFIADERQWEMVSPPEKNGALIDSLTESGGVIQAAANGGAIAYVAQAPIGQAQGNRNFEPTQMLATRNREGWGSQDIVTPNEHGIGVGSQVGSEYRFFSEDLSLALVQPIGTSRLAEPPLSPPITSAEEAPCPGSEEPANCQESTIYLREDGYPGGSPLPHAPSEEAIYGQLEQEKNESGYLALVNDTDVLPGTEFGLPIERTGRPFRFVGATPDLGHVLLKSGIAGKPECEKNPAEADRFGCTPGLYEWNAGEPELRYVSALPGGKPVGKAAVLGLYGQNVRHAISADGSRVVFSTGVEAGAVPLYLRDVATGQTLRLDETQGGSGEGPADAEFQAANAEGTRVFFTDTQRLTSGAGAAEGRPDLYVCEVLEDQSTHQLEGCKLTDLSAGFQTAAHASEEADVQGLVLGASEDGAYVYFVAAGVLTEAPNARHERAAASALCGSAAAAQASCNLYVEHYGGERGNPGWPAHPAFIARLSNEDLPDWHEAELDLQGIVQLTSRVSPDGRHLAFMSDRELTGYDNVDTHPQAAGAHDEEVYEYTAAASAGEAGALTCASCDPSGARPDGVYEPPEQTANPEGVGLLVDRPQTWAGRWLAGSVPGWTRLAEGGEPPFALYQSRYLSNSGRLFFDSPADLVPEAKNEKEDVYEYEPQGVPSGQHECTSQSATYSERASGCVGLISSGTSSSESAFLDASESGGEGEHSGEEGGGDVFFLTAAPLSPRDTDSEPDVYDAHECTAASPCHPETAAPAGTQCASGEGCHPFAYSPPAGGGQPAPSAGPGNVNSHQKVLATQVKVKPPTRAQKLAKALAACRKKYRHSKTKRVSCEKQAHKRYGPLVKRKATKGKGARR